MNADHLKELLAERPFTPLVLRLSDGRQHTIRHPEAIVVTSDLVALAIDDRMHLIAPDHIVEASALANTTE